MNINMDKDESSLFCIEDVVSYSNIEITHVNDNKPPMKVVATKVIIWLSIALILMGLFFI